MRRIHLQLRASKLIIVLFLFSNTSFSHAHNPSPKRCDKQLNGSSIYGTFSEEVLSSHGLDTKKIEIYISIKESHIHQEFLSFASISLWYDHKPVLYISVNRVAGTPYATPTTFTITQHKGKGLGTFTYLLLARYLYKNHKLLLISDINHNISKDARSLWNRLKKAKYAQKRGFFHRDFEFSEDTLNEDEAWIFMDKILSEQTTMESHASFLEPPAHKPGSVVK